MQTHTQGHLNTLKYIELTLSQRIKTQNQKYSTKLNFILQNRYAETSITMFSKINCLFQLKEEKKETIGSLVLPEQKWDINLDHWAHWEVTAPQGFPIT